MGWGIDWELEFNSAKCIFLGRRWTGFVLARGAEQWVGGKEGLGDIHESRKCLGRGRATGNQAFALRKNLEEGQDLPVGFCGEAE